MHRDPVTMPPPQATLRPGAAGGGHDARCARWGRSAPGTARLSRAAHRRRLGAWSSKRSPARRTTLRLGGVGDDEGRLPCTRCRPSRRRRRAPVMGAPRPDEKPTRSPRDVPRQSPRRQRRSRHPRSACSSNTSRGSSARRPYRRPSGLHPAVYSGRARRPARLPRRGRTGGGPGRASGCADPRHRRGGHRPHPQPRQGLRHRSLRGARQGGPGDRHLPRPRPGGGRRRRCDRHAPESAAGVCGPGGPRRCGGVERCHAPDRRSAGCNAVDGRRGGSGWSLRPAHTPLAGWLRLRCGRRHLRVPR